MLIEFVVSNSSPSTSNWSLIVQSFLGLQVFHFTKHTEIRDIYSKSLFRTFHIILSFLTSYRRFILHDNKASFMKQQKSILVRVFFVKTAFWYMNFNFEYSEYWNSTREKKFIYKITREAASPFARANPPPSLQNFYYPESLSLLLCTYFLKRITPSWALCFIHH